MAEIINIGNYMVNIFLIKEEAGIILIDSGYPGSFNAILDKLKALSLNPKDIKLIFLTHCHDDHMGAINELLDYTGAKLILHEEAVERVKLGHNPHTHGASYKLMQLLLRIMRNKEKYFPKVDNKEKYLVFTGSEQYLIDSGFTGRIVSLRGHTEDSIGILFPDGKLIAGDTAMNMPIAKSYMPLVLEDAEELKKSWDFMINNAKVIVTSHGEPIPIDKIIKARPRLNKLKVLKVYD